MNSTVNLLVKLLNPNAFTPHFATPGSAGFDLAVPSNAMPVTIEPGHTAGFQLGFATAFDPDFVAHVYPRSGWARKGIVLANTVAVIDSDYRGEWIVALRNQSQETFTIHGGDRIAQCVFAVRPKILFSIVPELPLTQRGAGGFGSTGQ